MTDAEPIDVVMCTWNSNRSYFRRCLLSVRREVAVHHFVVVDRYSSDGTLEAVRSMFPNAKIFQTTENLACARRIGIACVDTRYFAFIDDDIEVSKVWFPNLISLIKGGKHVAAVQGFIRYHVDYLDKAQRFELSRRRGDIREISNRGYTHNTIILTETVRDFNPPPTVHSWEDFLLTQHVLRKGYKWLETDQAQVIHYRNAGIDFLSELHNSILRAKWNGAGDRLVHTYLSSHGRAFADLLLSSFKSILYYLVVTIVVSDPRILLLSFFGLLEYFKGFLSAEQNIVPFELHRYSK